MKKLILLMVISVSTLLSNNELFSKYYKDLTKLNIDQINIMSISYFTGKQNDLGHTLAAIAWKESDFGRYSINLADGKYGSFGPYQIHLHLHVKALGIKTTWSRSREAERLINDVEYSSKVALEHLLYWKERSKGNKSPYKNMIASYNAGNAGLKNKVGKAYAEDVVIRVKVIEKFMKDGFPFLLLKNNKKIYK
ncbi:transglycosylase SLT domain-containing protein [Campylobacter coli]